MQETIHSKYNFIFDFTQNSYKTSLQHNAWWRRRHLDNRIALQLTLSVKWPFNQMPIYQKYNLLVKWSLTIYRKKLSVKLPFSQMTFRSNDSIVKFHFPWPFFIFLSVKSSFYVKEITGQMTFFDKIILFFYLPHMEYEGSIGFVMRKMKFFYCWLSRFRTFYG
jgi:hypothetical protein